MTIIKKKLCRKESYIKRSAQNKWQPLKHNTITNRNWHKTHTHTYTHSMKIWALSLSLSTKSHITLCVHAHEHVYSCFILLLNFGLLTSRLTFVCVFVVFHIIQWKWKCQIHKSYMNFWNMNLYNGFFFCLKKNCILKSKKWPLFFNYNWIISA